MRHPLLESIAGEGLERLLRRAERASGGVCPEGGAGRNQDLLSENQSILDWLKGSIHNKPLSLLSQIYQI